MKNNSKSLNSIKGQVVLIVLLTSAVIMTLGLSLSKKAVIDTKIDTDEELLKQAFNAAESGIDYYLGTGRTDFTLPDGGSKAQVAISDVGGGVELTSDGLVLSNNAFLFWLVNHEEDGSIGTNYYSDTDDTVAVCVASGFNKAIKIDYFYLEGGTYKVVRKGYNFDGSNSTVSGFASKTDSSTSDCSGRDGVAVNLVTGASPLLLVVTPIDQATDIILKGSNNFPIQGEEINSVGRAGNIAGVEGVNTKVKVINRYKVPSFMLDAITAGGSVTSE